MRRRDVLALIGGAVVVSPQAASAQQARTAKVGLLYPGPESQGGLRLRSLREVLRASNWPDERVEIVARYADGDVARAALMAKELVDQKADVLVAVSSIALDAARAATTTIPIVTFDLETDPIASGLASELARPGGNITGVFFDFPDFGMKWMELLKEAIPHFSKAVVVRHPASPAPQIKGIEAAGRLLNVKLDIVDINGLSDVDAALSAARALSPDAILLLSSAPVGANPRIIAEMMLKHRLPAITSFPDVARLGGLLAYGVDLPEGFRRTATLVPKVLNGAKPADLPIERPAKFQLVVNLKTAKALDITMPTSVLLRADEVIE